MYNHCTSLVSIQITMLASLHKSDNRPFLFQLSIRVKSFLILSTDTSGHFLFNQSAECGNGGIKRKKVKKVSAFSLLTKSTANIRCRSILNILLGNRKHTHGSLRKEGLQFDLKNSSILAVYRVSPGERLSGPNNKPLTGSKPSCVLLNLECCGLSALQCLLSNGQLLKNVW